MSVELWCALDMLVIGLPLWILAVRGRKVVIA